MIDGMPVIEPSGTRDEGTMRAYAERASTAELRAVLAEAVRDLDGELAAILRDELRRRDA